MGPPGAAGGRTRPPRRESSKFFLLSHGDARGGKRRRLAPPSVPCRPPRGAFRPCGGRADFAFPESDRASGRVPSLQCAADRTGARGLRGPGRTGKAGEQPGYLEEATMNAERNYLITREAAEYLGLSSRTLDRYRISGRGPVFHRFGGRVRYTREDLDAWAARRR